MRTVCRASCLAFLLSVSSSPVWAQPTFVNGILIPGNALDATGEPGANAGRFGHFSDIYYDPNRNEWWALSDRGPGGGLLDYSTRLQRFDIDVHPVTGRISNFRVKETIRFRDRFGFLLAPTAPVGDAKSLNGPNPGLLNLDPALPGRTFDPEASPSIRGPAKRVFKIDLLNATDVSGESLPDDGNLAAVGIVPVQKNDAEVFIDLTATTLLPNVNQADKWEGLAIGPRLIGGGYLILTGNDNDYSVTQTGAGEQFDVYVDFLGNFARCVLDDPSACEVNPPAADLTIDNPVALPPGYSLLPGVLHAYRASASDLAGYEKPEHWRNSLLDFLSGL